MSENFLTRNPERKLKVSESKTESSNLNVKVGMCIANMLALAPAVHQLHLLIKGNGSYGPHKALNELYDALPDTVDAIAEGYQGASESLFSYPSVTVPQLTSIEDLLALLREYSAKATMMQEEIPYSQVVSKIDDLKSLFDSTKYKLIFLK